MVGPVFEECSEDNDQHRCHRCGDQPYLLPQMRVTALVVVAHNSREANKQHRTHVRYFLDEVVRSMIAVAGQMQLAVVPDNPTIAFNEH